MKLDGLLEAPGFYLMVTALLGLLTIASLVRVVIGPTIWDRLLGFGLVASKVTLAVMMTAFVYDARFVLDIALLFSMFGFLTTALLARFVERRGIL